MIKRKNNDRDPSQTVCVLSATCRAWMTRRVPFYYKYTALRSLYRIVYSVRLDSTGLSVWEKWPILEEAVKIK